MNFYKASLPQSLGTWGSVGRRQSTISIPGWLCKGRVPHAPGRSTCAVDQVQWIQPEKGHAHTPPPGG